MGLVKDLPRANMGVDLIIKRVGAMYLNHYREVVWAVFIEILKQTPQYSGRAVANWNIGVGAPDFSYNDDIGDEIEHIGAFEGPGRSSIAHERGDSKWINYAISRNEPKLAEIQRGTRVYINNGIRGDDDNSGRSEMYLEELQNPTYWGVKLRAANKPYETAQETVVKMAAQIGRSHGFEFGAGGQSMRNYP